MSSKEREKKSNFLFQFFTLHFHTFNSVLDLRRKRQREGEKSEGTTEKNGQLKEGERNRSKVSE